MSSGIPPTFAWPVHFCLFSTLSTYVLSLITGNVSQVDRVWTFLPTLYTAYYALIPLWPAVSISTGERSWLRLFPYTPTEVEKGIVDGLNERALLMLGLQITWMCRLSYNTWRRGLFNFSDEDYRWEIFRQRVPKWFFHIFNFSFIAVTQNVLLFMLAIPTHNVVLQPSKALGPFDYLLALSSLVLLATEFVADNQQFAYQTFKRTGVLNANDWSGARIKWTQEDAQRGFVTRGLWGWSRHPNFFCEQSFWLIQCLFPILSSSTPLGSLGAYYSLIPGLALCILFFSSTIFTESISKSKYPQAYAAYQSRVSMFNPVFTPVWGWVLSWRGMRRYVDGVVFGGRKEE